MKENTRTQSKCFILRIKKTLHLTTAMAFFLQQFVPYSSAFAMDSEDTRAPSRRVASPFAPTSRGFTEHPTFIGALHEHEHSYEIWTQLSKRETEHLRPLTAKAVPVVVASEKIDFTLGKGNFGATYAGRNIKTREIYAIKEVYGRKAVNESLREGEIVHSLGDYLHIMPLVDYMHHKPYEKTDDPRLLQVMPLAYINGSGFKGMLVLSQNVQREKIVADSFYQIMMGLEYIHGRGVVHLDIKEDNTLYMQDGTLRIADFGRAKNLENNDQITDPYSLGDKRKFSPEIIALFRKKMGGTFNIVDSFSGKGADIWATGLYVWELLEDNEANLFSMQSFRNPLPQDGRDPLQAWAAFYTDERFEELLENISFLKGKFSLTLLNLLRQVLTVDPETRIKTPQIIKRLVPSAMKPDDRRVAFEELIRVYKNPGLAASSQVPTAQLSSSQISTPVYPPAEPTQDLAKSSNQSLPKVSVPYDLPYPTAPSSDKNNAGQMNSTLKISRSTSVSVYPPAEPTRYIPKTSHQPLHTVYIPADLYPGSPVQLGEAKPSPFSSDDSLVKARKAEKLEKAKEDLRRREELLVQKEADLQRQIEEEQKKQRRAQRAAKKQKKQAAEEELKKREELLAQREADLKKQLAAEEQRKKAAEETQRRRAIPQIAWGHEDVYERFLKGRLIYKPDEKSDKGKIELRIADLANPLEGEFDLSKCGDAALYLSINTGYRKGKRRKNKDKIEIWFAPHFLIEKNIAGSASHFKDIMGSWDAHTAPVGTFFTYGGWDDLEWYDYIVTENFEIISDGKNLYEMWSTATTRTLRTTLSIHEYRTPRASRNRLNFRLIFELK